MKKVLVWLLVVTMTATAAIGGTLAYFTDRDSEANVFTVGNVAIDLEEDFQHGATLIPGVNIEKKPTITNTGANDAWVWAEIAIPSELNSTASAAKNIIHFNMSKESVVDGLWNWWDGADYSEGAYMITEKEIDGVMYDVYTVQYETPLKPGETTANPVIYKVYMDSHVDIDPDGNWAWVEDGQVTAINWNSETNGNPVIYVSAYAMQTEGFDTVYAAYDAYQTQWADNGAEWGNPVTIVSTVDELRQAMKVPGARIVLSEDLIVDDDKGTGYCFYAKYDCQIDLNGHDIKVDLDGKNFNGVFYTLNGAKLDITGDGDVIIEDGIGQWVWCTGANGASEINIYGGNWTEDSDDFDTDYCEALYANREGKVNIYGGIFNWSSYPQYTANESREGVVTVYGGTFINFDPRVSHDSDGSYVAEGYTVVTETQSNGDVWYTVVPQ